MARLMNKKCFSGKGNDFFFLILWRNPDNRMGMFWKSLALSVLLLVGSGFDGWATEVVSSAKQTRAVTQEVEKTEIVAYENRIKISAAPVNSVIEIFSVVGIKVKEIRVSQPDGEYALDLPKGYYIIRLNDVVRKIVIR